VIVALVSDDELMAALVFKGGNAISIAYEVGDRGSAAIDFLLNGNFADVEATFVKIQQVLVTVFAEKQLHVFKVCWERRTKKMADEFKSFWGGYSLEFEIATAETARNYGGRLS
jgi:hypothetical protein